MTRFKTFWRWQLVRINQVFWNEFDLGNSFVQFGLLNFYGQQSIFSMSPSSKVSTIVYGFGLLQEVHRKQTDGTLSSFTRLNASGDSFIALCVSSTTTQWRGNRSGFMSNLRSAHRANAHSGVLTHRCCLEITWSQSVATHVNSRVNARLYSTLHHSIHSRRPDGRNLIVAHQLGKKADIKCQD